MWTLTFDRIKTTCEEIERVIVFLSPSPVGDAIVHGYLE